MTGKVPKITYKRLANHRKKCYTVKERQDRRNMLLDKDRRGELAKQAESRLCYLDP